MTWFSLTFTLNEKKEKFINHNVPVRLIRRTFWSILEVLMGSLVSEVDVALHSNVSFFNADKVHTTCIHHFPSTL